MDVKYIIITYPPVVGRNGNCCIPTQHKNDFRKKIFTEFDSWLKSDGSIRINNVVRLFLTKNPYKLCTLYFVSFWEPFKMK